MPVASLSSADIYFERSGAPGGIPLLLINGWSGQLLFWHPEFVTMLGDAGFDVIIFDNRDVGLSTKFNGTPPYTVTDMARDAADLIDHFGLCSAHVAGQSMGGMIAQRLAIDWPQQVRSLCSIYSAPSLRYRCRDPEIEAALDVPPAQDRTEAIAQFLAREAFSGTNGYAGHMDDFAAACYDRCYCPDGISRQGLAMQSEGDRCSELAKLAMPAAVIHGRADRLVSFAGGIATAEAIPDAELYLFAGLGHEMNRDLWPHFTQIMLRTATRRASVTNAHRA